MGRSSPKTSTRLGRPPFDDLMAVMDHVAALSYADPNAWWRRRLLWRLHDRLDAWPYAALQGAGEQDGVFDLRSESGETEELRSPSGSSTDALGQSRFVREMVAQLLVKDFHTPTLVIHGEQDFRVPSRKVCSFSPRCNSEDSPPSCCFPG